MKLSAKLLTGAAVAVSLSLPSLADTKVIHAGTLLTEAGKPALTKQTVIITDGKITAVKAGYQTVDGAKVIDLKNSFVMAGLMDMHVHISSTELGPSRTADSLRMSKELSAFQAQKYAMTMLKAGFTTIRDAASTHGQNTYALRDAINRGWVHGPRIIAAGKVGITGGHMDVSGVKPSYMKLATGEHVCDGAADCRRAARNQIKYGADMIKIASTGGVLTDRATGTGLQMEQDEINAVVQSAKRMGAKTMAHAHHEAGIVAALKGGVSSIEHGTYTGSEAIKWFKKTGAYLVPTLLAGHTVKEIAEKNPRAFSDAIRPKAKRVGTYMIENFGKIYKAGVKIAFGTDSGVSKHGINAQEAVLMHQAGMPVMDILKSATINAADLVDMSDSLGQIKVGYHADIIAVHGDPLKDVKELLDIDFVMKGGKVYKKK